MTLEIGNIMSTEHDLGIQVMVFLTGTGEENILEKLNVSKFKGIETILNPCKSNESKDMIKNLLNLGEYEKFKEFFLEDLIPLCGNIPRLNELFVFSINTVILESKITINFDKIMNKVQSLIVKKFGKMYKSSDWDKLLGQKEKKIRNWNSKYVFIFINTKRSFFRR